MVLDFGGVLDGYCVDLTRMAAVGLPTASAMALYEGVREANASAVRAVRPGVPASDIDRAARAVLEAKNLGEAFRHATGHGLGLEVHEAPRLARPDSEPQERLEEGMVFTIEPGAYVEGIGGVRLEDDVLVTPGGCEVLTRCPTTCCVSDAMDLDDIKQILNLVREHDLAEFELERDGLKVRIRKAGREVAFVPQVAAPPMLAAPPPAAPAVPAAAPAANVTPGPGAEADSVDLGVIKSPIVGTFYRSAEPGAPSFVEIGDVVKKGQVLCIIEAMKLMNEIESDCDGEIIKIYVENGKPVQYGDRLFAVKVA